MHHCTQLEDRIKQAQDQLQHTQTQLLELKGCDGIDDLQAQLQVSLLHLPTLPVWQLTSSETCGLYVPNRMSNSRPCAQVYQREETDAVAQLSKLQERLEADVAASLGINPEQQHAQLEAELQHQAALQQAQVRAASTCTTAAAISSIT